MADEISSRHENPVGSDSKSGKNRSLRKSSHDPGLTPTERHRKNSLMRQFMKNQEGEGPSQAYKDNYARTFGHD